MFGRLTVIGRLTKDPKEELRYVTINGNDRAVCEFSIAINYPGEEDATFIDFTTWDKNAENLAKYQTKGQLIYVEARPKTDRWNDKESGQPRSKLKYTADNIKYLERANGENGQEAPTVEQPKTMKPNF